jgi:hypothetical protein
MLDDNTIINALETRTNHHKMIQIQIISRFPMNFERAYCNKESLFNSEGLNVS